MVTSDRFLTALGEYLLSVTGLELEPRLRDWTGTKGVEALVLDADEPEELEGLNGVYAIDAEAVVMVHARDWDDDRRREVLGLLNDALVAGGTGEDTSAAAQWMSNAANERGIGSEALTVFELRSGDAVWEPEEKWLYGKIAIAAVACGG